MPSSRKRRIIETTVSPLAASYRSQTLFSSNTDSGSPGQHQQHHHLGVDDETPSKDVGRIAQRNVRQSSSLLVTPSPTKDSPMKPGSPSVSVNDHHQVKNTSGMSPHRQQTEVCHGEEKPTRQLFTNSGGQDSSSRRSQRKSSSRENQAPQTSTDDVVVTPSPNRKLFVAATMDDSSVVNAERPNRPRKKRAVSTSSVQDSLVSFFARTPTTNGGVATTSKAESSSSITHSLPTSTPSRRRQQVQSQQNDGPSKHEPARQRNASPSKKTLEKIKTRTGGAVATHPPSIGDVIVDHEGSILSKESVAVSPTYNSPLTRTSNSQKIPAHLVQLLVPPRSFQKKQPRSTQEILKEFYDKKKEPTTTTRTATKERKEKGQRRPKEQRNSISRTLSSCGNSVTSGSRRSLPRASKEKASMIFQKMSRYYFSDTSDDDKDDVDEAREEQVPTDVTAERSSKDSTSVAPSLPRLRPRTTILSKQPSPPVQHNHNNPAPPKKRRGRPPAISVPAGVSPAYPDSGSKQRAVAGSQTSVVEPSKRKRGRPRKMPLLPEGRTDVRKPDSNDCPRIEDDVSCVSESTYRSQQKRSSLRILSTRKSIPVAGRKVAPPQSCTEAPTATRTQVPRTKNRSSSRLMQLRSEDQTPRLPSHVVLAPNPPKVAAKSLPSVRRYLPPRTSFRRGPKFSMEEYSVYSNSYRNEVSQHANSSSSEDELPVIRVTGSATRSTTLSPDRKRSRDDDQLPSESSKRVRFDSEVTTFSVKIKIKTSLDPRRVNAGDSTGGRYSTLPPSLSESAVRDIADQVTRACLKQTTLRPSTNNDDAPSDCHPKWNNTSSNELNIAHLDVQEETSSQSSEASSASASSKHNFAIDDEGSPGEAHGDRDCADKERKAIARRKERRHHSSQTIEADDSRSLVSELTADWSRRSLPDRKVKRNSRRIHPRPGKEDIGRKGRPSKDDERSTGVDDDESLHRNDEDEGFSQGANFDDDVPCEGKINDDHSIHSIVLLKKNVEPNSPSPPSVGNKDAARSFPSSPSHRNRQSRWQCEDSLAGSAADWSRASEAPKAAPGQEQSSPSRRYNGRYGFKNSTIEEVVATSLEPTNKRTTSSSTSSSVKDDDDGDRKPAAIPTVMMSPTRKNPARVRQHTTSLCLQPNYRCGKCTGCIRTMDCQTCDYCLERLRRRHGHYHGSGSNSEPIESGGCILRRCVRARRVGQVDSLLSLLSPSNNKNDTNNNSVKDNETEEGRVPTKQLVSTVRSELEGKKDDVDNNNGRGDKATVNKEPWEEDAGDDWSVDYSYLSEPENRRRWEAKLRTGTLLSSISRTFRTEHYLNGPTGLKSEFASGGHTNSISSVSASFVMPSNKSKYQPLVGHTQTVPGRGRGRRGGGPKNGPRKVNPLHGMALPSPPIMVQQQGKGEGGVDDNVSVASSSWRENRKCLRALMEYDEADQEWM